MLACNADAVTASASPGMSNVPRREDHALPEIYAYGASVPSKPCLVERIAQESDLLTSNLGSSVP
jgi:hypothetical protein